MQINAAARLAVAWLTMFLVGTELFVFSPLLPVLAADYHIAPALAGLSVTMFSLAYMVSAPLFGYFSDRIGRRRVLICSLLAFALANILTAGAASLPSLLAVRLFAGTAAAGVSPSIYALVGSAAPPDRRATWLALVVSGLLVSLAVGASVGGLAGVLFGGPPVFLALATLAVVLVWLNRWAWPCDHGGAAAGLEATARDPLAVVALVCRLIPMVMWSTGLYGVYTYLGAGLAAEGFSTGQTAAAILFYGCGAIIGVLVGGRVADRLGTRFTATASFAGLCACLLLLRLALDAGRLVEPALGVSSAVAQLFFPAQQAGLAIDFPRQRAAVLAWNNSALFLGISLGSLVGGEAVALASFGADLIISAGIALAGCIVNAILVPGRRRMSQ
jgi:predicted MFS family arabinose efflux permease